MYDKSGYRHIPHAFFEFITFLTNALPLRSVPTFLELLIGAMQTQHGFVTHAWLAIDAYLHWTSYYKWIEYGKWSWVALARRLAQLVTVYFPEPHRFLALDDTLLFRSSRKAPGSHIYHQHGTKENRPQFVRGQNWICLAAVVNGRTTAAIPLLSRMMRKAGNSSKLDAAKVMIRTIAPGFAHKKVTLLTDSWYMRGTLIKYALIHTFQVIGQVRRDTALYDLPVQTGKRGRPRKYGDKYTPERVALLPAIETEMFLYGRNQKVLLKSAVACARFLKGRQVLAVWATFIDDKKVRKERLLLATDIHLAPAEVLLHYEKRWSIETMFNQVKNNWGWKEAWQQSRQVLHRWIQLLSLGYAIPQLLALQRDSQIDFLANFAPWRAGQPITAGRVRLGLKIILGHFRVRDWWNPKSRKFRPPETEKNEHKVEIKDKAA